MSCHAGPDIVENGLVFCYDMNNTQKSWRGKPTTNMLGNPTCLNNTGPTSVYYSGYEASVEIVSALNTQMYLISPYWIKYTKNSNSNGRIWFLGVSGLTIDTDYTYSVYIYTDDSRVTEFNLGSDNGAVSNTTNVLSSWSSSDINRVKRISATFRSLTGSQVQGCRISSSDPIGATFYMTGFQCEQQSIATPIVSGTRSNTQSILDLTNNNTITANNLTYNSDGSFSFDGTDEYIDSGLDISWNNTNSVSFTFVLKPASLTGSAGFAGKIYPDWEWAFYQSGADLSMVYWNTGGGHTNDMDWTASNFFTSITDYVIFQYVWDGSSSFVYKNGVLVLSKQAANPSINQNRSNNMLIGGHIYVWGDYYWNGSICFINVYNRALSAAEVAQNFNATRRIYGI